MFSFFSSLICAIGFYPLFYKLNKPASRWRSVALLAAIILGRPLSLLWQALFMFDQQSDLSLIDITVLHIAIYLLVPVLLGKNRLRTLISASFAFSIVNVTHLPVMYIVMFVIKPIVDTIGWAETMQKYPQLYYGIILLTNIVIAVCCLFAARWIRDAKLKPPLKLYVLFNLFFVLFPLAILILFDGVISEIWSIPFLTSGIVCSVFLGIILLMFYLYTRLTAENSASENSTAVSQTETKVDGYSQFIQHLSRRELEVIEAVLAGNIKHKELSAALGISVNTVKTHLKHIYQATGVSNIAALKSLFRGFTLNNM